MDEKKGNNSNKAGVQFKFPVKVTSLDVQKVIRVIVQGLISSSFVNLTRNEINVSFYVDGDYDTHYSAFIAGSPSQNTI